MECVKKLKVIDKKYHIRKVLKDELSKEVFPGCTWHAPNGDGHVLEVSLTLIDSISLMEYHINFCDSTLVEDLKELKNGELFEYDIDFIERLHLYQVYVENIPLAYNISYMQVKRYDTLFRYELMFDYKEETIIICFSVNLDI